MREPLRVFIKRAERAAQLVLNRGVAGAAGRVIQIAARGAGEPVNRAGAAAARERVLECEELERV